VCGQQTVTPATTTVYSLRVVYPDREEIKTVTVAVTPALQSWPHTVRVLDNRQLYYLRLMAAGEIRARVEWTGSQSDLSLIIYGPGQSEPYAQVNGASPLEVAYTVTAGDLAAGATWRVSIVSAGIGQAKGPLSLTYPGGSSASPYADEFKVLPGYSSAVSLIVLNDPGTINSRATWTGLPFDLELGIKGPGQATYYARQNGNSPLQVGYVVTAADLAAGDTWQVLLNALTLTDTEANIELTYP
jgi:hypothetical protein